MNPALMSFLGDLLRLNFHFTITSAFRTAVQNKAVGGVSNSQHMKGEAIDFKPYGSTTYSQLVTYIMVILIMFLLLTNLLFILHLFIFHLARVVVVK